MGDHELNLGKLTATLEQLALSKQLPLRQQVHKPLLKYNQSIAKPANIFHHHADLAPLHKKDILSPPKSPVRQVAALTPAHSFRSQPQNHCKSPARTGSTPLPSKAVARLMGKGNGNPYARPVSADEIADKAHSTKTAKSPGLNKNFNGNMTFKQCNGSLQLNTFMRPQSAVMKEKFEQATRKKLESQLANQVHSLDQVVVKDSDKRTSDQKHTVVPTYGGLSPKAIEEMKRVQNLNYTPTKPYSECSDTDSDRVKDGESVGIPQAASTKKPVPSSRLSNNKNSESSHHYSSKSSHQLTATTTMNVDIGDVENLKNTKKPPSSAKASNRTVYYKKGSKSEKVIHEPSSKAASAPLLVKIEIEKHLVTYPVTVAEEELDDDEYEDLDDYDDVCSPLGERLPGDGEASVDGEMDDEDDDGLDDDIDDENIGSDFEGASDEISNASSNISHQSEVKRPTTSDFTVLRKPSSLDEKTTLIRPKTASEVPTRQPLRLSLFPNMPPTINFVPEGEKVQQLPWEVRKLLKWRMSPITPNIVKNTLARVGFRITRKNHDWMGCFGKHMKSPGFKAIREYQKLNHFPGSFQIGRKDRLWKNLSKMQVRFGKKEFNFFPQTYVLPQDLKLLKRAWEDGGNRQKWIVKPPASARGIGIKVIHKWMQIPRRKPVIVQRYLHRPYLINDSKFDMRIYVYISCYDPLRIYMFEDGLVRFASCKYSSAMKSLSNKFMHLTNYSVNKKNSDYISNGDDSICQGHKWSLKALWMYLKRQGINSHAIWESIKDLVIKTIISTEAPINSMIKANVRSRYCVHELFGFDILLDERLKPWILEVNISPSLHSNSQLDINVKGIMIKDLLNIAGFRIPDKADITHHSPSPSMSDFSNHVPSSDYCMDRRLFTQLHTSDERAKHAYYCQRHLDTQVMQTIMDTLTPNDIRFLTDCIDEDSRKGGFQRIYPTPTTHKYLQLFEQPRYNNLLLDQWVQRFNRMEIRGITMLQAYCEDGVHFENPTEKTQHQWNPPHASVLTFRDNRSYSASHAKGDKLEGNKASLSVHQLPKVNKRPLPQCVASESSRMPSMWTTTVVGVNHQSSRLTMIPTTNR